MLLEGSSAFADACDLSIRLLAAAAAPHVPVFCIMINAYAPHWRRLREYRTCTDERIKHAPQITELNMSTNELTTPKLSVFGRK